MSVKERVIEGCDNHSAIRARRTAPFLPNLARICYAPAQMQVDFLEAKNPLSGLIRCAQAGDEVVVAKSASGLRAADLCRPHS